MFVPEIINPRQADSAPGPPHRVREATSEGEAGMYQISRSIYRELAGDIVDDRPWEDGPTNHERVLWACEAAVVRLTTDRHYFARPSRTLFNDIRIYFPIAAQQRVYQVIDRYLCFAAEYLATRPRAVLELDRAAGRSAAPPRARARLPAHAAAAATATAPRISTWSRPRTSPSRRDRGAARAPRVMRI